MIPSCFVRCSLFQHNRLVGTIPDSIASLRAVTKIDFANNTLTGAVPAAFWANPSLASLYAEHLQRQSGTSHGAIAHTRARAQMHAFNFLSSPQVLQRKPAGKPQRPRQERHMLRDDCPRRPG